MLSHLQQINSLILFQPSTIIGDNDNGFTSDPGEVLTAEPISSSNISISIEQPPVGDGNYTQNDSAASNITQGASVDVGSYTQEVVVSQGDLDPQTGVFYRDKDGNLTVAKSGAALVRKPGISVTVGANQAPQQVVRSGETQGSDSAKNYDLLSSSLAQAQIDLDPFRFIEDGSLSKSVSSSESSVDIPLGDSGAQAETVSSGGGTFSTVAVGDTEKTTESGKLVYADLLYIYRIRTND